MARERIYKSRWLWLPVLVFSGVAHGSIVATYELTRPEPLPVLTIRQSGEGTGIVTVSITGSSNMLRCSKAQCAFELPRGSEIHIQAVLGEEATFAGFHQFPMRPPSELIPYLGDPLGQCTPSLTGDIVEAAKAGRDGLDCSFTLRASTDVTAEFGLQPKTIDVKMDDPAVAATDPKKPNAPKQPPKAIEAEKLDEKAVTVALVPPKAIPPPEKQYQPPPPPPQPQKKPPPPPPNMTMVEVKDKKNLDKAPDDAKYLSDKNRDTDQETRATETNLDKESEGQSVASKESDDHTSKEIGGPDDKIRQLEETQKTTDKHIQETDHSGNNETAKGQIKGDKGDNGQEGTGENKPGAFAMRGIDGRGAVNEQGKDGKKEGRKGTPGINTPLSMQDYERIVGKEKSDTEREVAARKMSSKKGRWERKLDAIRSSLENFVPDVRPGNQTALKTRAHPYALYIARMHRRIHELWGFGFLEQLDNKGADDPLNNPDLWVNIEMSVNPDGTVHKVTIAKTSGKTEFDVAAVDTVISAGPYETTPEAIRSVDGRIYLRWGFYRNWRQCGTFNVEPYILDSVPDDNGVGVLDAGDSVKEQGHVPGKHKAHPTGDKPVTPDDGLDKQKVSPESSVKDKEALFQANKFISAFTEGEVDKLVKYSISPFYAGGKVAAQTQADLKEMFSALVVESGLPLKEWKLLTPSEYGGSLPDGNLVLQITTQKETFAIVLTKQNSGEWRATQLARN